MEINVNELFVIIIGCPIYHFYTEGGINKLILLTKS